jgi:hypothetical protein
MFIFRRFIVGVILIGVTVGGFALYAQQQPLQPGTQRPRPFMRAKLTPAQEILEGIAVADFQSIIRNTERIRLLTLDENWMVRQTDAYRRQSEDFSRAVTNIQEAAKQNNLDGVTLGYMQMTLKCVECHRHIRDDNTRK